MRLSAPKQITWIISLILGLLGILGALIAIPGVSAYSLWLVVVALALLLYATATKSL